MHLSDKNSVVKPIVKLIILFGLLSPPGVQTSFAADKLFRYQGQAYETLDQAEAAMKTRTDASPYLQLVNVEPTYGGDYKYTYDTGDSIPLVPAPNADWVYFSNVSDEMYLTEGDAVNATKQYWVERRGYCFDSVRSRSSNYGFLRWAGGGYRYTEDYNILRLESGGNVLFNLFFYQCQVHAVQGATFIRAKKYQCLAGPVNWKRKNTNYCGMSDTITGPGQYQTAMNPAPQQSECGSPCSGSGNVDKSSSVLKTLIKHPIDPTHGNKYYRETLIAGTGIGSLPLSLSYNSAIRENTGLGVGWTHSYSQAAVLSTPPSLNSQDNLIKGTPQSSLADACTQGWDDIKAQLDATWKDTYASINNGRCDILQNTGAGAQKVNSLFMYNAHTGDAVKVNNEAPKTLNITRPDGSRLEYVKDGSQWVNRHADQAKLESVVDGGGQTTQWQLTTPDDSVEVYNAQGQLLSIQDKNGRSTTFSYNGNGSLSQVSSDTGKTLQFSYDILGRISVVQDDAQRQWLLSYDAANNLSAITYPDGTVADLLDNPSKRFHYEHSLFPHALTGMTQELGTRLATYDYDALGRAILSTHIDNVDRVDVAYNPDGSRTITNSRGFQSTYQVQMLNGKRFISRIDGPACSNCGEADSSYEADSAGHRLKAKTVQGLRTEWGNFDSRDNPGYEIQAAGTPQERRKDFTYDDRFHYKIKTMTEPSVVPGQHKVTTFSYDANGNTTAIRVDGFAPDLNDPGNTTGIAVSRTTSFKYLGPLHQLSEIDGPLDNAILDDRTVLTYYPNNAGEGFNRVRLKKVTAANGIVLRDQIQYSATGKVISEIRPNGLQLSYAYYPGNDRLKTVTQTGNDGASRTTHWTYLANGRVETVTVAYGSAAAATVTFGYDAAERLTDISDALGHTIHYTLDTEGNTLGEERYDANQVLQQSLSRTFDAYNRLDQLILPNATQDYDFAPNGTLQQVSDGKQQVTRYDYDALRRLTTVTQPGDITSQYAYDAQDQLQQVTDPRNNATQYVLDDLGNRLSRVSPDTGTSRYEHDAAGNIIAQIDAKGQRVDYLYDALNRPMQASYADGAIEQFVYDTAINGVGRLAQVSRALNGNEHSTVEYAYNGFGEIAHKRQITVELIDGIEQRRELTTSYAYNALGQVNKVTYPSGTVADYGYAGGRIHSVSINGSLFIDNIVYHSNGAIESWQWAGGAQNGTVYVRQFDSSGRLSAYSLGAQVHTLSYDANHNVELVDSANTQAAYTYDALDRLRTTNNAGTVSFNSSYDYDANSNRTLSTQNGSQTDYRYPLENNLLSQRISTDPLNAINTLPHQYDANGNTTHNGVFAFAYDAKNRLIAVDNGDTAKYLYNALGQRVKKNAVGNPADVNGDGIIDSADIIATNGPNGIAVDCNGTTGGNNGNGKGLGNTKGQGPLSASMSSRHKPIPGQNTACIANQIGGNPNSPKTKAGGGRITLYFAYNESGQLIGQYKPDLSDPAIPMALSPTEETIYLGVIPVATVQNGLVYTVYTDHLNTPRLIQDSSARTVWTWDNTDPFGGNEANDDPDGDGIKFVYLQRFAGQYYDAETQLHYNYFRYYDPQTGRYVTSDPIGLEGGLNTFGYVGGNPIANIDPLGLEKLPQHVIDILEFHFPGFDFENIETHQGFPWYILDSFEADAFTNGYDIYFKNKKYDPCTAEGIALIGHEIEHSVQYGKTFLSRARYRRTYAIELKKLWETMDFNDAIKNIPYEKDASKKQNDIREHIQQQFGNENLCSCSK